MDERNIFKKLNRLKAFCNLPKGASWNNYKVLKTAIQCEQKDVALFLLSAGCRVNSKSAGVIDNTPLHYAVRLEDTDLIQTLICKGASLTSQDHRGDTPLHVAAMSRNTEIVDILLHYIEQTQYINPGNNFGLTHMHIACMRNKPEIVEKFLRNGVGKDISISLDSSLWPGYTPLHLAVEFCCLDVIQLLLKHDAKSHYRDTEKTSPCSLSRYKYQTASMVNYVLSSRCCSWDNRQINFLVACMEGDIRIVKDYVKYGANVADYNAYFYSLFLLEGDTPLHCAVRSESVDIIQLLLKNNADINCVNHYGMTPLHTALYQDEFNGSFIGVMQLLYPSYNFKVKKNVTDRNGLSFFHIMCVQGDNELIKYFLEKGVDINSRVDVNSKYFAGYTPLYFAIRKYRPNTVKLLLQCGADITISAINKGTPFELAILNNNKEIIELIVKSGVNVNDIKNETGQNPFHLILKESSSNLDIIKMFYNEGCNVNSQDNNGDSPLHISAYYPHSITNIQTMLDLGADINIENMKGETPLITLHNRALSFTHFQYPIIEYAEIYDVFLRHIEKLKTIGLYVSEKNRLFIEQLFKQQAQIDPSKIFLIPEYYSLLQHKNQIEVDLMKRVKLSNYSSLHNIVFADANQMAFHCKNPVLKGIIESNDFDFVFKSYNYLFKLQFKKGDERKPILGPAKDALKYVLGKGLPDVCSEKVFSYLSDNDLKTIIEINGSTNIQQMAKNRGSDVSDLEANE